MNLVTFVPVRSKDGATSRAGAVEWDRIFRAFVYYGSLLYLFSIILDGLLRFALVSVGAEALIYMRDVFIVVAVFGTIYRKWQYGSWNKTLMVLLLLLGAWSFVGLRCTSGLVQVLFGVKLFLPLMLGIVGAPVVLSEKRHVERWILILWFVATFGIFLSAVVHTPWSGLSYKVGDIEVEGNREWSISGTERLSGFARSSISVSTQILLLSTFLMCFLRSMALRSIVWIVSGPAMFLSTSRSAMAGYLAVSVVFLLRRFCAPFYPIWRFLPALIAAGVVTLPLLPVAFFTPLEKFSQGGVGGTNSFFDRIEDTWPEAFDLVEKEGNVFLGRGVGGIGTPQNKFEPELYNPADNLFVYLFVDFGIASVLFFGWLSFTLCRKEIKEGNGVFFDFCVGVAFLGVGLNLNCIEDPCMSIFLGMLLADVFAKRARNFTALSERDSE